MQEANLANLLAQQPRLHNHALAMRSFPQRPGEDADIDLLETDAHAQVLNARSKEELITEEGLDHRGQPRSQTRTRRSCSAMVHCSVNLHEEPIMGR